MGLYVGVAGKAREVPGYAAHLREQILAEVLNTLAGFDAPPLERVDPFVGRELPSPRYAVQSILFGTSICCGVIQTRQSFVQPVTGR